MKSKLSRWLPMTAKAVPSELQWVMIESSPKGCSCGRSHEGCSAAFQLLSKCMLKSKPDGDVGLKCSPSQPTKTAAHRKITLDHPWHPGRGNPEREKTELGWKKREGK